MAGHTSRSQLPRLLQLILALQANRFPNARRLAEMCEVSRRTIFRDLLTLEAAGIPVRYEPDRQGYQIAPGFVFHPVSLQEREAKALLMLTQARGGDDGLGLRKEARCGAQKVISALPPETRSRITAMAELVLTTNDIIDCPPARRGVYDAILESLVSRVQIRVHFREPGGSAVESTKVSPYRVILNGPRWYLIGRSSWHRDVHLFRLPWIERVELTDDPSTIPPRFDLEKWLGHAWLVQRGGRRVEVWLRFSPWIAPEVAENHWHPNQRLERTEDGSAVLRVVLDGWEEILPWILSFGDQVEVLAPPELRERVRQIGLALAQSHEAAAGNDR